MIPLHVKVFTTLALSLAAAVLYAVFGGESRRKCLAAMLLSSAGDLFMINLFGIGSFSTYIGAAFFIAAHLVYAGCFAGKIKTAGRKTTGPGFYAGLAVILISAFAVGTAAFTVPEEKKPVMFCLILIYIAAIGANVCMQFSWAFIKKGTALILPAAVTLFYLTDIFIFADMLNINSSLRRYVWHLYPLAQLAVVVFNSGYKKQKRPVRKRGETDTVAGSNRISE